MRKTLILLVFLLFISPVFAAGNLTVTKGSLTTPTYINTRTNTVMLNLTLNATIGEVNVTGIIINFTGTATVGNITGTLAYNDSNVNGVIDSSDTLWGSNSTVNSTFNSTQINFATNYSIPENQVRYMLIAINLSSSATRIANTSINITANTSILTGTTDNITIPSGYINSTLAQIQDVHANVSVSPRIVDTGVINQSFIYTIIPTGTDKINRTILNIPTGYSFVRLVAVTYENTNSSSSITNVTSVNQINITASTAGTTQLITIYFDLNINTTAVNSSAFTLFIEGSNMTNITTDVINNQTNVTTQNIITVQSVSAIKTTALINGTDYWEFNMTLNITNISSSINGLIQFKMTNWNNSASFIMNLTNGTIGSNSTAYYASLRDSGSSSNIFNVTNEYNLTSGVSKSVSAYQIVNVVLKMIIPSSVGGVAVPVSSSWWTTYNILFRSTP